MNEVERFFRVLVHTISVEHPQRLQTPLEIAEIYQSILPYRRFRNELQFETNQDYEMALLQLLAGEHGYAWIDPNEVQTALADEASSVNPNPGAFREFAAAKVFLNVKAVETVETPDHSYAPASAKSPPPPPAVKPPPRIVSVKPERRPPPPTRQEATPAIKDPVDWVTTQPARTPRPTHARACHACGGSLPTGSGVRFCPHCGVDVIGIQCRQCALELEPDWEFCIRCGQNQRGHVDA